MRWLCCYLDVNSELFDFSVSSLDPLSGAALPRAPVDPCSRESVLKVLKNSGKREVEDEDKSFTAEQESKRRYEAERLRCRQIEDSGRMSEREAVTVQCGRHTRRPGMMSPG